MGTGGDLRREYRSILGESAAVLILVGAFFVVPLLGLLRGGDPGAAALAFLPPAALLLVAGLLLRRAAGRDGSGALTVREGGVIVLITWTVTCLVSAWPIMSLTDLRFAGAVFESVSGWTTTGLSVVVPEQAPPVLLLWRSLMQLAGGAGLAVIMLAALTSASGPGLSAAEGRQDLLVPNVRRSAKLVLLIYAGYFVAGCLGYLAAGMDLFDSVNHSAAAVSTGGFSTRTASIGAWDSPAVEGISMVLMVLGNLNFLTAWALVRGRFGEVLRDSEARLFLVVTAVAVPLVLVAGRGIYPLLGRGLRVVVFECVSALTTTGFTTTTYAHWRPLAMLVLILLMWIGGGTCSTAGGLKQYRVAILFRSVGWEVRRLLRPVGAVEERSVAVGGRRLWIDDGILRSAGTFVFLYFVALFAGTAILAACGNGLSPSLFEMSSAVSTVGLSVGITSAGAPCAVLWTLTAGMFFGRLEFLVLFAAGAKLISDLPWLFGRRTWD